MNGIVKASIGAGIAVGVYKGVKAGVRYFHHHHPKNSRRDEDELLDLGPTDEGRFVQGSEMARPVFCGLTEQEND